MKKVLTYIKRLAKLVNKIVVGIALVFAYLVICLYHLLTRQKTQRWESNKHKVSLEQTKHLW
jgi:hypothetical protein